jgi:hypothetical protein
VAVRISTSQTNCSALAGCLRFGNTLSRFFSPFGRVAQIHFADQWIACWQSTRSCSRPLRNRPVITPISVLQSQPTAITGDQCQFQGYSPKRVLRNAIRKISLRKSTLVSSRLRAQLLSERLTRVRCPVCRSPQFSDADCSRCSVLWFVPRHAGEETGSAQARLPNHGIASHRTSGDHVARAVECSCSWRSS